MSYNAAHDNPMMPAAGTSTRMLLAAINLPTARKSLTNFLFSVAGLAILGLQGCATIPENAVDRRSEALADDRTIESKATARLHDEIRQGYRLKFTSYNRHVLITGEAPDSETRTRIAEVVMKIEDVRGVWNEVTIIDNNSAKELTNDPLVASRVRANLVATNPFVAHHVRVVVDSGTVFLLGIVNPQEAWEAIQIARTTSGVRYVVNTLQVVSDAEIQLIEAEHMPLAPVTTCTESAHPSTLPAVRETW